MPTIIYRRIEAVSRQLVLNSPVVSPSAVEVRSNSPEPKYMTQTPGLVSQTPGKIQDTQRSDTSKLYLHAAHLVRLIVYIDTRLVIVLIPDETWFVDENNECINQEELMYYRSNTSTRSLQGVWTVRFFLWASVFPWLNLLGRGGTCLLHLSWSRVCQVCTHRGVRKDGWRCPRI